MTRKQALKQAIRLLSENPENAEVIEKLQDIYDELPLIHWSEAVSDVSGNNETSSVQPSGRG